MSRVGAPALPFAIVRPYLHPDVTNGNTRRGLFSTMEG